MMLVHSFLFIAHIHVEQFLACLLEAWCLSRRRYLTIFQIVKPLFQRRSGHIIKLIDSNDVIFRKHLLGCTHLQRLRFMRSNLKRIVSVHTSKGRNTMVQVVSALAHGEVNDIDRINLLNPIVFVTQAHIIRYHFRNSVQNTFQVMNFARQLYFHNYILSFAISRHYIYAVEFV